MPSQNKKKISKDDDKVKMDLVEITPKIDINHWYYKTKFLVAQRMLTKSKAWPPCAIRDTIIADIGAGSGIFLEAFFKSLEVNPKGVYAIDIFYPDEFLLLRDGIYFTRMLPGDITPTYLFFMDILEHIDNDIEFLEGWVKKSASKSYFLFTVPAFQFLWSCHDVVLKHKRRYKLKEIEKIIISSGLKVVKSRYFFATILPWVFFIRKFFWLMYKYRGIILYDTRIKPVYPFVNFLLKCILKAEIYLGNYNRFFGLSCIVVAKKP